MRGMLEQLVKDQVQPELY